MPETDTPSTTFNNLQEVDVTVRFADQNDAPVPIDGVPVWEVADGTLVELDIAEDGLSAVVRSTGQVGTTFVTVRADAQLGDGERMVQGSFDVEVTESGQVLVKFAFGEPRNR